MPAERLKRPRAIAALFFLVILAGCSAPLKAVYNPSSPSPVKAEGGAILVEPFEDGRGLPKGADPATIGRITATVFDLRNSRLTLSVDPAAYTTAAFVRELRDAGFVVKTPGDADTSADYVLTGTVKDFRLDIVERDEVSIETALRLVDARTHSAVWSGNASVNESRFAGVMGNTRDSISSYLESSLSKAIRGALPGLVAAAGRVSAPPLPAEKAALGRLIITSAPTGAKVYIKGVYQGLTPVTVEREPGVYEVEIRKKGFKGIKEEVSVRAGQTTELPEDLEKE